MIEETLTDLERRRLLELAVAAVPRERGDPELTRIIAKLSGTDTVLIARRAYPSSRAFATENGRGVPEGDCARPEPPGTYQ